MSEVVASNGTSPGKQRLLALHASAFAGQPTGHINQWLGLQAPILHQGSDEQSPNPAVAIQKWVDGRELNADQCKADQSWQLGVLGVNEALESRILDIERSALTLPPLQLQREISFV